MPTDAEWESFDDEKEEEDGEDEGQEEDEEKGEEMEATVNKTMGDEEENGFTTEYFGEKATTLLQNGLLSKEQRTRIYERNCAKRGMLSLKHPLTYF